MSIHARVSVFVFFSLCNLGRMHNNVSDDLMSHLSQKSRVRIIVDELSSDKISRISELFHCVGITIQVRSPRDIAKLFQCPKSSKITRLLMPEGCTVGSATRRGIGSGSRASESGETDSDRTDDDTTDDESDNTAERLKISNDCERLMKQHALMCAKHDSYETCRAITFLNGDVLWGFDESIEWQMEFLLFSVECYLIENWRAIIPHHINYGTTTVFVQRESGKGNESVKRVARTLGYNVRILPFFRPLDQVALDYDRIISFANLQHEEARKQVERAYEITTERGTVLYVFDIEKRQWQGTQDGKKNNRTRVVSTHNDSDNCNRRPVRG